MSAQKNREVMLACVDVKNVAKYARNKLPTRAHNLSLHIQFGEGFNGSEHPLHIFVLDWSIKLARLPIKRVQTFF